MEAKKLRKVWWRRLRARRRTLDRLGMQCVWMRSVLTKTVYHFFITCKRNGGGAAAGQAGTPLEPRLEETLGA